MLNKLLLATTLLIAPVKLTNPQLNTNINATYEEIKNTTENGYQVLYRRRIYETLESQNFRYRAVAIEKQEVKPSPYTTGKFITEINLMTITWQENTHSQNNDLNLTSYNQILNNYINIPITSTRLTYGYSNLANITTTQKQDLTTIINSRNNTTYDLSIYYGFMEGLDKTQEVLESSTYGTDELQNINNGSKIPLTTSNNQFAEKTINEDEKLNWLWCRIQTNEVETVQDAQLYPQAMNNNMNTINVQAMWAITPIQENVDLPGFVFTMLGLPFAWISTAFNLTIFPGTPYAINLSHLLFSIIGALILIVIVKKLIK